ncbi:AAA family ATPase [Acinetobacter sp. Ac_3412]|uniref:AAA family ATPase n=1 Tax=Acinetobacter sp. Ac_3412 TaxID=1848935 RepID=UPI00149068A3|nr:AAA family ATPase [Acinetobacter sp. Ac_3412]NNP75579.1 AAA family ATPase [Acinetobacter sp. Ac_3412]
MAEKLYYWAENLENYSSDIDEEAPFSIEIKKLNFFIGKNNSGKSRFIRSFFKTQKYTIQDFSFPDLTNIFNELKELIPRYSENISINDSSSRDTRNLVLRLIDNVIEFPLFPKNKYKENYTNIISRLETVKTDYKKDFEKKVRDIQGLVNDYETTIEYESSKFYIPILRGMRPVTEEENKQPYIERAQKDYFPEKEKFGTDNIVTGERLYYELKTHLLGEPEQRDLIKSYEEKLSQYFFDNEHVSLIPKHDQDVVNIKIGSEKQFPISQLGDGLQQAIILTYEAYIKNVDKNGNKQIHAFFIEEPELNMHAGMVRQLMNFYLNETNHYYFFTTHSNHLLDMVDESDEVIIQKFVKQPKVGNTKEFDFKIYRCDKDHELLSSLGVRPSSLYLANCTIWVEGVTDRMYLSKLMQKYIQVLDNSPDSKDKDKAKKYKSFMPNFHYAFIEYAGGNITHWSFLDDYSTRQEALEFLENNKGLTAKAITKNILLLADGDNEGKAERLLEWRVELKENVYTLPCKEIENTLTASIIYKACLIKFMGIKKASAQVSLNSNTKNKLTQKGFTRDTGKFDIEKLSSSINFISDEGIGKIIDDTIRIDNTDNTLRLFSDASGTIDDKVSFCEICKVLMTYEDWELTEPAKSLCEKIFNHIATSNN